MLHKAGVCLAHGHLESMVLKKIDEKKKMNKQLASNFNDETGPTGWISFSLDTSNAYGLYSMGVPSIS